MADSIHKVHQMTTKIGWEFEDIDIGKLEKIYDKASAAMAKGLVKEASVAFSEIATIFNQELTKMGKKSIDFSDMIKMPDASTFEKMTSSLVAAVAKNVTNGVKTGIEGIGKPNIGVQFTPKEQLDAKDIVGGDGTIGVKVLPKVEKKDVEKIINEYEKELNVINKKRDNIPYSKMSSDESDALYDSYTKEIEDITKRYFAKLTEVFNFHIDTNQIKKILKDLELGNKGSKRITESLFKNIDSFKPEHFQQPEDNKESRRTQLLNDLDSQYAEGYYSIEDLERVKAARQEIIDLLKQEGLLTDEINKKHTAITTEIQHRIDVQKAHNDAERIFEESNNLYDQIMQTEDPDEAQKILSQRKKLLEQISPLTSEDIIGSTFGNDNESIIAQMQQENTMLEHRIELLKQVKQGLISIDDVYDILNETGSLDDKLQALSDVAGRWGQNIKDSVAEEDDDAQQALEEFEETYDRIILKLENGKKIEILPNAKGLRALHKYYDGLDPQAYGETEIADIIFERKKKEVVENQKLAITYDELKQKVEAYYKIKKKVIDLMDSDQSFVHLMPDLNAAKKDIVQYFDKHNEEPTRTQDGITMMLEASDMDKDSALRYMAHILGIEIPKAENTYVDSAQNVVATNHKKIESYEELRQILQRYKDAVKELNATDILDFEAYDQAKDKVSKITESLKKQLESVGNVDKLKDFTDLLNSFAYGNFYMHEEKLVKLLGFEVPQSKHLENLKKDINASQTQLGAIEGTEFFGNKVVDIIKRKQKLLHDYLQELIKIGEQEQKNGVLTEKELNRKAELIQEIRDLEFGVRYKDGTSYTSFGDLEHLKEVLNLRKKIDFGYYNTGSYATRADTFSGDKIKYLVQDANFDFADGDIEAFDKSVIGQLIREYQRLHEIIIDCMMAGEKVPQAVIDKMKWFESLDATQLESIIPKIEELQGKIQTLQENKNITSFEYGKDDDYYDEKINELTQLLDLTKEYQALNGPVSDTMFGFSLDKNADEVQALIKKVEEVKKSAQTLRQLKSKFTDVDFNDADFQEIAHNVSSGWTSYDQAISQIEKLIEKKKELNNTKDTRNDAVQTDAIQEQAHAMDQYTEKTKKAVTWHEKLKQVIGKTLTPGKTLEENYQTVTGGGVQLNTGTSGDTNNTTTLTDTVLEATLKRVFANILNPETKQNDGDAQEPWALETTLQTVKGVLDNILTKTGTAEVTIIADDGVLSAIKAVVESIDKKIVQGTKVIYKEKKDSEPKDKNDSNKSKKSALKDLEKKAQESGKYKAQYEVSGNIEAQARAKALDDIIAKQAVSLKLSQEEILALVSKKKFAYEEAFLISEASEEAKERLRTTREMEKLVGALEGKYAKLGELQASSDPVKGVQATQLEKEIQLDIEKLETNNAINDEIRERLRLIQEEARLNQAAIEMEKDEKAAFKERIRLNREQFRVNTATSVWGSGQKVLESLWKIDSKENPDQLEEVKVLRVALDELRAARNRVNESIKKGVKLTDQSDEIKDLKAKTLAVNEQSDALKKLIADYHELSSENLNIKETGRTLIPGQDLETQLTNAVKALPNVQTKIVGFDAATGRLKYTVKTGAYTFQEYEMAARKVGGAIVSVQGATKRAETFFEGFVKKLREFTRYFSASSLIYKGIAEIRKGVQYVREIDVALTELKKVTDETEESYEKFLNTAAKTADKVGSTIKEIVSSTADWARIGYSLNEAATLAETTSVLLNVSEFKSIEEATSALTSTLQAFGYTAEQSMDVVDVLNEVGNNFAISSDGIATALQDSASSLMAANNSYQEAVALIASANRVVQDPNSVGAALRTISLRLRGTSVKELEEAGEDTTGAITSKSKLRSKVKTLSGVDILTDTGAYKSTYDILLEISKVWKDMSDIDQAALLELIAGKTRSNTAAAILGNTKDLQAAFESAMDAEGSAMRENEKYLDSIQGKLDLFNNAVQTMWSNTLDSEFIKSIISLGTEIIKIIDKIGLLKSVLLALAGMSMLKNKIGPIAFFKGVVEGTTQGIKKLGNYVKGFKDIKNISNDLAKSTTTLTQAQLKEKLTTVGLTDATAEEIVAKSKLGKATDELSASTLDATLKEAGYSTEKRESIIQSVFDTQATDENTQANKENAQSNQIAGAAENQETQATQMNVSATKQDTQATKQNTQANKENAASTVTLGQRIKGLGKSVGGFIKQNAATFIALATTLLTIGLTKLVDGIVETMDEANGEFNDAVNALDSLNSELQNLESQLEDINDQITELTAKTPLTYTDHEELSRLKEQSAELQRQIDLTETLKTQSAIKTNNEAIQAANMYKNVGVDSGKTTGERVGDTVKTVGGVGLAVTGAAAMTAAGTMATVGAANAWNPVGWIALAAAAVTAIAALVTYAVAESEEKVGESLDNMKEQYTKLQNEYDEARAEYNNDPTSKKKREKFEDAQEALRTYQANMSEYLTEMDVKYQQIKDNWDVATEEQKKEYTEWADTMDTWAIQSNSTNAKTNAIARLFGETASDDVKEFKKDVEAAMATAKAAGTDPVFDFQTAFNAPELAELKERLYDMGLTVTDVQYYFLDLARAEKEAEDAYTTYDTVKQINTLSKGVNSLKDAFGEIAEEGYISTETLVGLEETFGSLGDSWSNFVDTVATGTSSLSEATEAIEELVEAYLTQQLASGPMSAEERIKTIMLLQQMGVKNAQEYVDAMARASMATDIGKDVAKDDARLTELTNKQSKYNEINSLDVSSADLSEYGLTTVEVEDGKSTKTQYVYDGKTYDSIDAWKQDMLEQHKLTDKEVTELTTLSDGLSEGESQYQTYIKNIEEIYGIDLTEKEEELLIEKAITAEKAEQEASAKRTAKSEYDAAVYQKRVAEETNNNIDNKIKNLESDILNGDYEKHNISAEILYDDDTEIIKHYVYNGKKYYNIDDLGKAVAADLEATKVEVPSLPAEVTEIAVQNAEAAAETANNALKAELKEIGLDVDLVLADPSDLVDQIQDVFDTLKNAQKEYDESGYLSVDTLQTLLKLEPKYLDLLVDESGNLNLTEDALYDVARARIIDMGQQAQKNILTQAEKLATEGSASALAEYTTATANASVANEDFITTQIGVIQSLIDARVASGELTQEQATAFMDGIKNQIKAIQVTTESALGNLEKTISNSGNNSTDIADDAFKKVMAYWDNRIEANEAKYEQIQNDVDWLESQGKMASADYYKEQIDLITEGEESKTQLLNNKLQQAAARMQELEAAGRKGSEEWWEAAQIYNNTLSELDDVRDTVIDLQDAIGEVKWSQFEEFNTRLDDLNSKLQTMRDLLAPNGEEDWFDDEGNWTEKGVAVLGTYMQEYEHNKKGLQEANSALTEFQAKTYNAANASWFAENYGIHSEQEYYDYLKKLTDEQYNYATAVKDSEQDVADMYESQIDAVEEYIGTLVEGYQDYIDMIKESLDAERDLYSFKKNVQKQTKDIASLERRIASLSGSSNAADIAERRKLEAELAEQREALNDTYYEHSMDSQQNALDQEAQAYEEAMNKFVENLRTNLDSALDNMDSFMAGVTAAVTANAPLILDAYENLGISLDSAIVDPWEEAEKVMSRYTEENGLGLMNSWVAEGGVFSTFATEATTYLTSIWDDDNVDPDGAFSSAVLEVVTGIKNQVKSNVQETKGYLTDLYNVKDTSANAPTSISGTKFDSSDGCSMPSSDVKKLQQVLNQVFDENLGIDGVYGPNTTAAVRRAQTTMGIGVDGYYGPNTQAAMQNYIKTQWQAGEGGSSMIGQGIQYMLGMLPATYYAKGTLGTKQSGLAITDESWIGEEITLAAGKNGQLQYLKKGSAVLPADISANLIEWGKLNPNMMKVGGGANFNMISNAVNKPEFSFAFDSLVHVDHCDQGTIKDLEKMVDNKINQFNKQMNYAIKRVGGR